MDKSQVRISSRQFDAVIFDMDGVITRTAELHAAAWKRMFDDFLAARSAENGERLAPFDIAEDYLRYVDGKPRYDGVRDFLRSRGIELAEGRCQDGPDRETIHALGAIEGRGIGILGRDEVRPTRARYALENPGEVGVFLRRFCRYLAERDQA